MQDKNVKVLRSNLKGILIALLTLVCLVCGLFLGINSTTVFANAEEQNQIVMDYQSEEFLSLYLDSDYLYDKNENSNQATKIQNYVSSVFVQVAITP